MKTSKTEWQIWLIVFLGFHWGVSYAVRMLPQGPQDLSVFALLGLLSPLLLYFRPAWLIRIVRWFCFFQVGVSALLFFGSLISAMNPIGFHIHLFGIKLGTVWSLGGQFIYLGLRATAFGLSAIYLNSKPEKTEPNQSLQTMTIADTSAAAHPPRQL
jgi:ABC-type xylose transport system permease subunit